MNQVELEPRKQYICSTLEYVKKQFPLEKLLGHNMKSENIQINKIIMAFQLNVLKQLAFFTSHDIEMNFAILTAKKNKTYIKC